MKKLVDVDEAIWKRFEKVAVAKFGLYGAIRKGIAEAVEKCVIQEEAKAEEREEECR